ncbi:hypothetical protein MP228_008193 [Amoeboaphelidium protococcarum]|nr:hypothetical protein MP228_008193 [Amoeboaphelidium protococcarum]
MKTAKKQMSQIPGGFYDYGKAKVLMTILLNSTISAMFANVDKYAESKLTKWMQHCTIMQLASLFAGFQQWIEKKWHAVVGLTSKV